MGRAAQCSKEDPPCSGSLEAMLHRDDDGAAVMEKGQFVVDGYFCTACMTVYEDIKSDSEGILRGVNPQGQINEQDTLRAQKEQYEKQIAHLESKLVEITEYVVGDDSDLAQIIRGVLEKSAQETVSGGPVPAPKVDESE